MMSLSGDGPAMGFVIIFGWWWRRAKENQAGALSQRSLIRFHSGTRVSLHKNKPYAESCRARQICRFPADATSFHPNQAKPIEVDAFPGFAGPLPNFAMPPPIRKKCRYNIVLHSCDSHSRQP